MRSTTLLSYPWDTVISDLFNPRCRSLLRGSVLTLASLAAALLLSHFPHNHATPLLVLPTLTALAGMVDHVRCMRTRWSFYHGGVLLCVYMDLMVVSMIVFFLLFPYASWLSETH